MKLTFAQFQKYQTRHLLWGYATIVLMIGGLAYWHYSVTHPTTDDAYVDANIIYIAAQIEGPVQKVYVNNYQQVQKGQLLFAIDQAPFIIAVDQATAQLKAAKQQTAAYAAAVEEAKAKVEDARANFAVASTNVPRTLALVKTGVAPEAMGTSEQGRLDSAKAQLHIAENEYLRLQNQLGDTGEKNADVQAAQASLEKAKLDLTHTRIYSPASGTVANLSLRAGSMVDKGKPQFAIIDNQQWWINANFKETELMRIHAGQVATIKMDMYPGVTLHGKVERISGGSGSTFSLLPPENASGNWVKVTQRFPVKVVIIDARANNPLRVGASTNVTIDTTREQKTS